MKIAFFAFVLLLLSSMILQTQFVFPVDAQTKTENYIDVPFHGQVTGIYCGPACLEMIFDYYGEVQHPFSQIEIAEVARTLELGGTFIDDMIRAGHFSNLSTSSGTAMPENITGYSTRQLGYGAFGQFGMTIEDLKTLIDYGYPIIVLMRYSSGSTIGHYRVVIGYEPSEIVYHDPYGGPNVTMPYWLFNNLWEYSSYCGLFVSPWNIELDIPTYVQQGNTFTVTADIAYPCPVPFRTSDYPASSSNATIILPLGLTLASGETSKKTLDTGDISAGGSTTIRWTVKADSPGAYNIVVEAEGEVTGYSYKDRIGGFGNGTVKIKPTEAVSADLVQRKAWPEHRRFVLSKDGDPAVDDRHGTPGYQTLYGMVMNMGNVSIPHGMYWVVWTISDLIGSSTLVVETVGVIDLAPGGIAVLACDISASDLASKEYYVEAQCYYYWVAGKKVKTFSFIVVS